MSRHHKEHCSKEELHFRKVSCGREEMGHRHERCGRREEEPRREGCGMGSPYLAIPVPPTSMMPMHGTCVMTPEGPVCMLRPAEGMGCGRHRR